MATTVTRLETIHPSYMSISLVQTSMGIGSCFALATSVA
jgi:hypothetical protein